MYTALVLNSASHRKLVSALSDQIPDGWEVLAHHMTINMGPAGAGPAMALLGKTATLKVVSLASDNLVMAVGVESAVPSKNSLKHVTVAVNRKDGGKPFFSNGLKEWRDFGPIVLKGTVEEVGK